MKFSILQEKLAKSLQTVYRAIPTKSSLPILSNILLETKDGNLYLSATNLETAINTNVGASIDEEGTIAVPAKLLKEFVTNLPAGTLKAELKNYIFHVKSDKTKSKFNGVNAQDYPQLPTMPKEGNYIELDPTLLEKLAQLVTFAAGNDSSRPVFTGIYINFKKDTLTIAATDGFRLSEILVPATGTMDDFSTIIPAKTFNEIAKIFSNSQEKIKMYLNENENLLLFVAEETMVATRILDGQYPDYKKIIPVDHTLSVKFSAEEFAEAVKLTNIFAKESGNTIKVGFDPEQHTIRVVSLAEETGEHESIIPAEIEGEALDIAFNSKYLLDFLNNIKGETINLKTNGSTAPCLIQTPEHENFLHIIMPLQV